MVVQGEKIQVREGKIPKGPQGHSVLVMKEAGDGEAKPQWKARASVLVEGTVGKVTGRWHVLEPGPHHSVTK